MRANVVIALALGGAVALAACSDHTEDAATETANSAARDTAANLNAAGWMTSDAAADAANAADRAGDAIGNAASDAFRATGNALDAAGNRIDRAVDGPR